MKTTEAVSVVFPEPGRTEFETYAIAEPSENEIVVETEYSGVSQGTEIWAYQGRRPELVFPTVPGYQSIGRVVHAGCEVSDVAVGDRVMVKASRLPNRFPDTWMGAHSSLIVTSEAVPLPAGCDPVGAAISALAAVSLRGIRMLSIDFADVVAVVGQGLIGQCSAQLARLRGAVVVASDINPGRLALSGKHSADVVVNSSQESLADVVAGLRDEGIDSVIETTGRSDQFAPAIDLLCWEGQLLLQGWYPEPISFDFHATHLKKPKIAVTCGFDFDEVADCLSLLAAGKLNLRELVTHLEPITKAPDVYPALETGDPAHLGVVFDWTAS